MYKSRYINTIIMKEVLLQGRRYISQHLTIYSTNAKSSINFRTNLLKAPSNFGYYTSRVTRLYNEDRWQASILDVDLGSFNGSSMIVDSDFAQLKDPVYTNKSPDISKLVFAFGVFDGHGGDECSQFLKDHLYENVEKVHMNKQSSILMKKFFKEKISGYWKRWCRKAGGVLVNECKIDKVLKTYASDKGIDWDDIDNGKNLWDLLEMMIEDNVLTPWEIFKMRVWYACLKTDIQFLSYENYLNIKQSEGTGEMVKLVNAGSTSTSCFIYAVDHREEDRNGYFFMDNVLSRLVVAHIGDTRAIICDKNGVAHSLTKDHHPSNPIEANRLRKYSTGLIMTDSFGEERFMNYANTRSFGDITGKDKGISAEPELSEYLIGDVTMLEKFKLDNPDIVNNNKIEDFGGDECFLVLVSDGVTNILSDQETVDLVMSTNNHNGVNRGNPERCAKEVISFVEDVGGEDNATCLVIRLKGWGKWPMLDRTGKLREERMMGTRHGR